jgi:hypothetical protein
MVKLDDMMMIMQQSHQALVAVMRLNLMRPIWKPWAMRGITRAPCRGRWLESVHR